MEVDHQIVNLMIAVVDSKKNKYIQEGDLLFSRPFINRNVRPPLFVRAFDMRTHNWHLTDDNEYVRFAEFFCDNDDNSVFERLINIPTLLLQRRNIQETPPEVFEEHVGRYMEILWNIKYKYIPRIENIAYEVSSINGLIEEYEQRAKNEAMNVYQEYINLVNVYIQMINL